MSEPIPPPRPAQGGWLSLPTGQCVPLWFADPFTTGAQREAVGFHWDGDVPVFPANWPRVEAQPQSEVG